MYRSCRLAPFGRKPAYGLLIVFVTGLLPLALLVTGFLIWRHKRRAARLRRHQVAGRDRTA